MKKVGITDNYLTEKNRNHILTAFGTLLRKKNKTVVPISKEMNIYEIETKNMPSQSISISNLRKETSVFYSDDFEKELYDENLKILTERIAVVLFLCYNTSEPLRRQILGANTFGRKKL
jgi:type III restriction enzyme